MIKKDRLFFLDSARGFCMLLVILGHIWESDAPLPVLIYSFHIPLFFIISGILLGYTQTADRDIRTIIRSRLRGLIIPYLFFEIVFAGIYGILNHFDFGNQNIFGALLLNPLNVPLWFLPTLFISELLLILLLKAEKSGRLMMAVSVLLYLIPFFVKNGSDPAVQISPAAAGTFGRTMQTWFSSFGFHVNGGSFLSAALRCCTSVGFTALGYAGCSRIQKDSPHPAPLLLLLVLDGALALLNGKTGIYKLTFGNPFLFTLCAASGSFLVLSLLKRRRIRILEWIGKNTLVFLGLHIIALRAVQMIPGFHTDSLAGGLAAAALVCVLLVPAALFLNRFAPVLAGKPSRQHDE